MSIAERLEPKQVTYPDSDGQPMADSTLQFEWIDLLKGGLESLFKNDPDVFVAGDLLWYPVEGEPAIRCAQDALVAFGRPKGYRGSYRQWQEANIAPQVVFEVLSPGNRIPEMLRKFSFYERHGVEEYYLIDPDNHELYGWKRVEGALEELPEMNGWVSPRLGIRFEPVKDGLRIYRPDGKLFKTYLELDQHNDEVTRERDAERERANRLEARLRELGIDPE